jgi:hypothetical protein
VSRGLGLQAQQQHLASDLPPRYLCVLLFSPWVGWAGTVIGHGELRGIYVVIWLWFAGLGAGYVCFCLG